MKKSLQYSSPRFIFVSFVAGIFLCGCIRLWGGATYVRSKPGDYEEKTYVLDTAGLTSNNQTKGNIKT